MSSLDGFTNSPNMDCSTSKSMEDICSKQIGKNSRSHTRVSLAFGTGRLENATIFYDKKLTEITMRNEHDKLHHAEAQAVLSSLRLKFWPITGRSTVRRILRKCITSFKCNPVSTNPVIGNLPSHRTNKHRVLLITAHDYAGPITSKEIPSE